MICHTRKATVPTKFIAISFISQVTKMFMATELVVVNRMASDIITTEQF